ncbi:unnamed protein product, partial [Staurois parvus]
MVSLPLVRGSKNTATVDIKKCTPRLGAIDCKGTPENVQHEHFTGVLFYFS